MVQHAVYLGVFLYESEENVRTLQLWMKKSIDVNYVQLIDSTVQFNYTLVDFLPAGSVSH